MNVFTTGDLANILAGLAELERAAAKLAEGTEDPYIQGWHDGLRVGLLSVGLAVGLRPMLDQQQQTGPTWVKGRGHD